MLGSACSTKAGNTPSEPVAANVDIKHPQLNYRGEITPEDVYQSLAQGGTLVDVRTTQEWLAGVPDVSATQGKLATISWRIAPNMLNADFIAQLSALGVNKDAPLFFLCRSGGRSLDASVAATAAGFSQCYNVTGGFEGDAIGWKAVGLPWKQG